MSERAAKDKPWVMRTYAGHSSPKESNALYRNNLSKGQTGLSVAFDLPTQTGHDPDAEAARGEVGRVGVPIAHVGDLRALLDGIPLAATNTSMTINATAMWLLALYQVVAEVGDGHADAADLAPGELVVGVVAGLRREVEGDGQARLPLGEVAAEEGVRLRGARVARVGAHHPGCVAGHRPSRSRPTRATLARAPSPRQEPARERGHSRSDLRASGSAATQDRARLSRCGGRRSTTASPRRARCCA